VPIDPILQQLLEQIPTVPEGPIDYPTVRQQAETMIPMLAGQNGLAEVGEVADGEVPGATGAVPVRIYRPTGTPIGTLHFIHGGGWAVGSLATVDHTARRFCRNLSMVVVTSTYRLAPENPFPAGFDDSMAAARWVSEHRDELGGHDKPLVIAGDSAGGNLAAAVCIHLRDDVGSPPIDIQMLLYPAVDLREGIASYASRSRDADPTLRAKNLQTCCSDYAGSADPADVRLSPIMAVDLSGLPPALIVVLEVDPLRDEAVSYSERLRDAGVTVELLEFDNLTHGFVHLAGIIPAADQATEIVENRLAAMLANVGN